MQRDMVTYGKQISLFGETSARSLPVDLEARTYRINKTLDK